MDREILETVHKELGGIPQKRRTRSIEDKHVLASLGETCFGFPMKNIVEIQQLPAVTYLPNLPAWIPGVCNLRGNIVSIVDIKQLLGFEASALGPKTRLVVVRTDSQDLTAGFVVDEIVRITEMEPARIKRPVGPMEGQIGPYLKGTYETLGRGHLRLGFGSNIKLPDLANGLSQKSEIRISKSETVQMTEIPIAKSWARVSWIIGGNCLPTFGFGILNLFRISDFVTRIFNRKSAVGTGWTIYKNLSQTPC